MPFVSVEGFICTGSSWGKGKGTNALAEEKSGNSAVCPDLKSLPASEPASRQSEIKCLREIYTAWAGRYVIHYSLIYTHSSLQSFTRADETFDVRSTVSNWA